MSLSQFNSNLSLLVQMEVIYSFGEIDQLYFAKPYIIPYIRKFVSSAKFGGLRENRNGLNLIIH